METPASPPSHVWPFGDQMKVEILQGDILKPGRAVQAVVSSDDNYMTMGSGVSAVLRVQAKSIEYVRQAQAQCPVKAGSVVITRSYGLKKVLNVDHVLHAAIIDYDTDQQRLTDLVEQATTNCLERAETLGVTSLLLPAFATGAGKLSMEECARRMCSAIKAYLAELRGLREIYLMLYLPGDQADDAARAKCQALNERFLYEANLVLGTPYDPALRVNSARDFYGGQAALKRLTEIITGQGDTGPNKLHAVILGGPNAGKWALLDHLHALSQQPGSPLSAGRRLVKLTFGRVHESTPPSFIYRKFLCALGKAEQNSGPEAERLLKEIRRTYSDPKLDCDRFLAFLDRHPDRYNELVFLIDRLPRLLRMESKEQALKGVQAFWYDLDKVQTHVRFIYTARLADSRQLSEQRLATCTDIFKDQIEQIWVSCISDPERGRWVDDLFRRYLACPDGAPACVHAFFKTYAGRHPYLISLLTHALAVAIKRNPPKGPKPLAGYPQEVWDHYFQTALNASAPARQRFFERLMAVVNTAERATLETLARIEAIEAQESALMSGVLQEDPKAQEQFQALVAQSNNLRQLLNPGILQGLEQQGYLVDVATKAQFMAAEFGRWMAQYFGLGTSPEAGAVPADVQISLLSEAKPRSAQAIRTLFRGEAARIASAVTELEAEEKPNFFEGFGQCLSHLLHPVTHPEPGWLQDVEQVGSYVLAQFTTTEIKRFFQHAALGTTVLFEVDDAFKDIPWELMLETAYAGEIPFRVGRRTIGQQPANLGPIVRGADKVKALLIGDPTDDLPEALAEVDGLEQRLLVDERFEAPDVLRGSEQCQRGPILSRLGQKKYGLIHYSGHTKFNGYRSAWQLKDGALITTADLTNALQMGPPAFVFSSSCESATAAAPQPVRYENQTFDLPSAFLQAGVEAYLGTLWEVDATEAHLFVDQFYTAFLSRDYNLGECLRRAKWARKKDEAHTDRINWLAFILYGDPHLMPGDLFPALQPSKT